MIGLRQETKSSPDALGRSAGVISFLPLQRVVLASRPRFLFANRTSHLLAGAARLDGCCDHTKMIADEEVGAYSTQLIRDADLLVLRAPQGRGFTSRVHPEQRGTC